MPFLYFSAFFLPISNINLEIFLSIYFTVFVISLPYFYVYPHLLLFYESLYVAFYDLVKISGEAGLSIFTNISLFL